MKKISSVPFLWDVLLPCLKSAIIAGVFLVTSIADVFGQCNSPLMVYASEGCGSERVLDVYINDIPYFASYFKLYKQNSSGGWDYLEQAPADNGHGVFTIQVSGSATYGVTYYNNTNGCESTKHVVTISTPSAPSVWGSGYSCEYATAHVQVFGTEGVSRFELYRYNGGAVPPYQLLESNYTGIFTINDFNSNDAYSVDYYVRGITAQGCSSDGYTRITIEAVRPVAPTVTGNTNLCYGSSTILTASGGYDGLYRWFKGSNLIPDATGSQYATEALTASTIYYVSYMGSTTDGTGHCESPKSPIVINVKGVSVPEKPVAVNSYVNRCGPGTVVLQATLPAGHDPENYSTNWYATPEGGTPLYNETTYRTDPLSASTTFYATTYNRETGCESPLPRAEVTVTVTDPSLDDCDMNYIVTNDIMVKGITDETLVNNLAIGDRIESTQYFDGLGRPLETVQTRASPGHLDVVVPVFYDAYGRESRKYLPFTAGTTGKYKRHADIINPGTGDYIGIAAPFYDSPETKVPDDDGDRPFAETIFEQSPLNRVLEQGAPGAAWQPGTGKTIKKSYVSNVANEVRLWTYTYPTDDHPLGLIESEGAYSSNELYKNVTTDEHGNDVIEYVDKEGRTVLKRVQAVDDLPGGSAPPVDDTNYASTYYIYDDFGNLVCVLQPEGVKNIGAYLSASPENKEMFLQKWAFRYRYDERKRMIIKQVPGADSVVMVYDVRDRLVLTQDGNGRAENKWLFTKYDALNRPVITGIYTHGSAIHRKDMVQQLSTTNLSETFNGNAASHGYTNVAFPSTNIEVLTVTYYDNYDFASLAEFDEDFEFFPDEIPEEDDLPGQDESPFDRVKTLVTGTKTKVLGTNTWLCTANYYDDKYRLIQSTSDNHKNGITRVTNVYDFVGKLLRAKTFYSIPGHPAHAETSIFQRYSYDHAGRLLKTWHRIGASPNPEVLLSSNEYNELGELVTKGLHGTASGGSGTTVSADPLANAPGTLYGQEIVSESYTPSQNVYISPNSIRLMPGFVVPEGSTFTARIGYSQADAETHNNNSLNREFLQTIDYRYNIRGWLKQINDPLDPVSDDLFSMDLRYTDPTANGGPEQFNGNISEIIWKSAGLDKQSYGYGYDAMNRIEQGLYYNLDNPVQNGRYSMKVGDAEATPSPRAGYDLNGNIQNLIRKGRKAEGVYGLMDDLHYDYTDSGNRLMYVSDSEPVGIDEKGFTEAVEGTEDYAYDNNGNLTKDENKGIVGIAYNHLNLPVRVLKSEEEYMIYTYDATGRKLSQQVFGSEVKTTEYVGELVFEGDVLQFVLHPEGRAVAHTGANPWEYQYFLKDHLGNVRLTVTENRTTDAVTATLEDAQAAEEEDEFLNYAQVRKINLPMFDHTDAGDTYNSVRLMGGNSTEVYGLATSVSVMPGDRLNIEVYVKYLDPESSNWSVALLNALENFTGSANPGGTFTDGSTVGSIDGAFPYPGVMVREGDEGDGPRAYLNYIIFDRDFNFINAGYRRVSTGAREAGQGLDQTEGIDHEHLFFEDIEITQPGYVYIYLSNESDTPVEVFFDDFRVEHVKSEVVQVEDYYPFGATFNSYSRENSVPQNFLYQEKEWQQDLSLNLYDFEWRQYDPFTNRTTTMDPHADSYPLLSPYSWAANNPLSIIDPDGRDIVNTAFATTYTGADAQNMFRQLQSQQASRSSSEDPDKPTFYSFNSRTQARREQMAQAEKDNQPGFWSGARDGVVAGGESTIDFVKSLGTVEGWKNVGRGLATFAELASPIPNYTQVQFQTATTQYVQNIPNMSAYEIGYDLGFGAEKLAETILLSKGAGAVTNLASRSRLLFDVGYKTLRPWGVVNTNRYWSGLQIGDFRFQFHKHALRGSGSVKLPHINIGTGGAWHIMLNRPGARQVGGWIFRGAKGS